MPHLTNKFEAPADLGCVAVVSMVVTGSIDSWGPHFFLTGCTIIPVNSLRKDVENVALHMESESSVSSYVKTTLPHKICEKVPLSINRTHSAREFLPLAIPL